MEKGYKFLEDEATADIAFEAYGKDLNELFENSALAVEECMVKLSSLKLKEKYKINLESESIEELLYDFLSELIFIKDTEGLLFKKFKVKISKNKPFKLTAECDGEKINRDTQELLDDAKAVTKHLFEVKKIKERYIAKVIVDI